MIKKFYGLMAASLVLGLASCSDENPWMGESGHGAIKLNLTADGSVKETAPGTRADLSEYFDELPAAADFNIHLQREDGSTMHHVTHDEFLQIGNVPTGSYTLTAYTPGDKEGFECPYFEGKEKVTVLEGRESNVLVTAKLANSMISVDYTEGFTNYMKAYSAELHSDGGLTIPYVQDETRPAFVMPGDVDLYLSFTNPQGKELTILASEMVAKAACHHKVTLDVNDGDNGVAQLTIEFKDELEDEVFKIDLTEELFTAPAPTITLSGAYESDGSDIPVLEFLAGAAPEDKYRFDVISHGGMKEVNLTLTGINGTQFTPDFGNEVNLVNASEEVQAKLRSMGIDCKGLFKNPDRMAIVDFSNLAKNLKSGNYQLSLRAVDKLGRASEASTVNINAVAPQLTVEPQSAVYGTNRGSLVINYNGSNPDDITFKARNKDGRMVDAPVDLFSEMHLTRAITGKNYLYTIKLPDMEQNPIDVDVYLFGVYNCTVQLSVEMPEYTVVADGFAKRVMLKVEASPEQLAVITENLKVYNEGRQITSGIERDGETGIIIVPGLNASTTYNNFVVSLISSTKEQRLVNFTTEEVKDIENGDFSNTHDSEINNSSIWNGGEYEYWAIVYQTRHNTTSIAVKEPDGPWASINQKTCYANSNPINSWFYVPSTFMDEANGRVVIRSVAYDHEGILPVKFRTATSTSPKFSPNTPQKLEGKAAGELFVGTYSYTGTTSSNGVESRKEGISFSSRPSYLTFDYSYAGVEGERGYAFIEIINNEGQRIAFGEKDLSDVSTMTQVRIDLNYTIFGSKCTQMKIGFKSTKGEVHTILPTDLDDIDSSIYENRVIPANGSKAISTGSVLTIDNVKLNY